MHNLLSFAPRPALLLLALLTLPACDRDTSNSNPGQPSPPPDKVRLGYFANVTHAQAVLGVHSGEFGTAISPSRLETRVFNAGPALIEALFAGEIDIGYVGPGPAIAAQAKSRGQGIRVVSGAAANGIVIVARKDSGITKPEDLKGRKLATPQLGNTQDIAARHYLKDVLKQPDVKNVIPINNAEQAGMMARGDIDAAWAPEPWGSRLIVENGATLVGKEEQLWPGNEFTIVLVVTTPEFLKKHPDVVEKVLGVHRNWTRRLSDEPEKHLPALGEALLKINQKALPPGVLPMAIKNVKFTDEPLEGTLKTMADWSYQLEFTQQPAKLDGFVDLSILRKLQAADNANPKQQ